MKILAIVPARSGSKRIPGKNKKIIAGKPLISWTIEEAKKVKEIDKILVSTDDSDIISIAELEKVDYIKRDPKLSTDTASTVDVILDVIYKTNDSYNYIIILQPTSPLRNAEDISSAIKMMKNLTADAIVSVTESNHPVQWMNVLPEDNSLEKFLSKKVEQTRSQDLEKYYRINGAIYICKVNKFLEEKTLFLSKNIFAYKMEQIRSIDIDEEIDFKIAEMLLNSYRKGL